ncbi:ABC transporter permease [Paenarthrobacter ureafaciens]|jgi:ABC-type nitrate/sulfonate/bicarbonate transport system permease component|uniref:ABC transporter permease n=1 Tax=Paenarthrobacter ureafaciens TaxID=37931 RepID=UPI001FB45A1D|nr:ABC transporter permease [Paenarthrobacter ureafaciens]UOD81220.1 ABC transporter permease [Paenarthrobacter ureafaciens]WNZ03870.1 ABC transporter permease [Paenarthrobacter ureafaciens]
MIVLKRLGMWLGLPAILIAIWWAFTAQGANFFVPKPDKLATTFVNVWFSEKFFTDVVPSMGRLLISLAVSLVLGVALGIAIGLSRTLRWFLEPLLEFIRAVPSTILIPVLLLLIGINDTMKITVIVLGCLWPVLLNTIEGARSLDEVLKNTALVYRLRGFDRIRYLVLPGAMPLIMAGIRHSLAVGLILLVVSEMFASTDGIGYSIINFQNRIAIPEMWSGIFLLGIIGVLLSVVFQAIQKRVLGWYYGLKEASNDG